MSRAFYVAYASEVVDEQGVFVATPDVSSRTELASFSVDGESIVVVEYDGRSASDVVVRLDQMGDDIYIVPIWYAYTRSQHPRASSASLSMTELSEKMSDVSTGPLRPVQNESAAAPAKRSTIFDVPAAREKVARRYVPPTHVFETELGKVRKFMRELNQQSND